MIRRVTVVIVIPFVHRVTPLLDDGQDSDGPATGRLLVGHIRRTARHRIEWMPGPGRRIVLRTIRRRQPEYLGQTRPGHPPHPDPPQHAAGGPPRSSLPDPTTRVGACSSAQARLGHLLPRKSLYTKPKPPSRLA